jgi:serine/threonine protein kinase
LFGGATRKKEIIEMIENEARAISKLCAPGAHRNIVAVFRQGIVVDTTMFYYDMELCEGTLEEFIELNCSDGKRIGMSQMWNIMTHIASGIGYIHGHGEVHRDLKPRNGIDPAIIVSLCPRPLFTD